MARLFLLSGFLFLGLLFSCGPVADSQPDSPAETSETGSSDFPYELSAPAESFQLPKKLKEISGLSAYGSTLASVQDEKGNVYLIDPENGEIVEKVDFGKDEDYEGIASVKSALWVLQADGKLFELENLEDAKPKTYKTFDDADFDAEGLAYDSRANRLLIACKGFPGEGEKLKGKKAIYAFDLSEKELVKGPVFVLDPAAIDSVQNELGPSGIAVHPRTGEVWVLSHRGKKLIVLGRSGQVLQVVRLDPDLFPQAEGITFFQGERLAISTEGVRGDAQLHLFDPLP